MKFAPVLILLLCLFGTSVRAAEDGTFVYAWKYWQPRVQETLEMTGDYWQPRVQKTLKMTGDYWVPRINDSYLPKIQGAYSKVDERLAGSKFEKWVLQFLDPGTDYESQNPGREIPPWLIIRVSKLYESIIRKVTKAEIEESHLSETSKAAYEFLKAYMVPSNDVQAQSRVQILFDRLKPFVTDPDLRACQHVVVLQTDWANTIQSGCRIYLTQGITKHFKDEEIIALLAHELTHELEGHVVRSYGRVLRNIFRNNVKMVGESTAYVLTGQAGKLMRDVSQNGVLWVAAQEYGKDSQSFEIDADRGAVRLLCRLGISPQRLVDGLRRLAFLNGYDESAPQKQEEGRLRAYPGVAERISAIESEAKDCTLR